MVEKIIVNPTNIRAYGDILEVKGEDDFEEYYATLTETTDTVQGATMKVFELKDKTVFYDPAKQGAKNTNWLNSSNRLTINTDENGTTLTNGSSNGFYFVTINSTQYLFYDYIVEFDVLSVTNTCFFYEGGSGSTSQNIINLSTNFASGGHCKIVREAGVVKIYKDGTQVGSNITPSTLVPVEIGFRINGTTTETRSIKYANFRVIADLNRIFTDDATSDKSTQYNTNVRIGGTTSVSSLTYDSTNQDYNITNTTLHDSWYGWTIPNTKGMDNIRITCKVKLNNTSAYNQFLIGCADNIAQSSATGTYDAYRIRADKKADYLHNSASEVRGSSKSTKVANNYVYVVFEKSGTTIKGTTYDNTMTQLSTYTYTGANSYTSPYYFFLVNAKNSADTKDLQLVKVEQYTPEHSYALTFSQATYEANILGDATVAVTLTDNGTPVSGATITFTYNGTTSTATTSSTGVASKNITVIDNGTVTATYGTATATCTVTGGIDDPII